MPDRPGVALALVTAAAVMSLGWLSVSVTQTFPVPPVDLRVVQPDPSFDTVAWNRTNGPAVNLDNYTLAWSDEFDTRRILAGDQSGSTRWYAGAQGGPYGAAAVGYGVRDDVYLVSGGVLTIRAHAYTDAAGARTGNWYSGHLQAVNTRGEGFAVQEGYFEARMKFPQSLGAWPAFWLKPRRKWLYPDATNVELDIVEWYGGDWYGHHHTVHIGDGPTRRYWSDYENVRDAQGRPVDLSRDWHTHGALVTKDWFIVYLDRVEIGRFPMFEVLRTPMYPQLTLSILKDPQTGVVPAAAISPMDLQVDYVRVYTPRQTGR